MSRSIGLAVALLLAVPFTTLAQEPAKPGKEHAELKKMEGVWDAVMKMAEAPEPMPGVVTYKMELDGLWLTSDFRMDVPGFKFQGRGTNGYDLNKKKYVGIWVDSMSSAPMVMEGTHDEATNSTTMTGEGPGQDGKPQKFKTVTKEIDGDHMKFEMFMIGADGKETSAFTIDYTRRKK
jgi:hypothetical protein